MTSVDILICTFRRPQVAETLRSLAAAVDAAEQVRIVIADNDSVDSARARVAAVAQELPIEVVYVHAPQSNISIARNACLDCAQAEWVAFLDDDETAAPDWLHKLLEKTRCESVDGVFGPAKAVYAPGTPTWMVDQDHHSNIPVRRNGAVMTGHSCNALLRWAGTPWHRERFDLARGRSGGEDTEFFFRLFHLGARFEIAEDALVYEKVDPKRVDPAWLRTRKFRMGQSYAASAQSRLDRLGLLSLAAMKAAYCNLQILRHLGNTGARNFWALRRALHLGVCAGCLSLKQHQIYGS